MPHTPTYASLHRQATDGHLFFRVWTPSPPSSLSLPSRSPRLSDTDVLGRSIIRHLILAAAERASLRAPPVDILGLDDDSDNDDDDDDYDLLGGEAATGSRGRDRTEESMIGEMKQREAEEGPLDDSAMDLDEPFLPPRSPSPPSPPPSSASHPHEPTSSTLQKSNTARPTKESRKARARAAKHARTALAQLGMSPLPCMLEDSPWSILTSSLDRAWYRLARAVALDRRYERQLSSSRVSCEQGQHGRKWYLSVHHRPSLQERLNSRIASGAPLILNVADALQSWEEGMPHGTKRQIVRTHRRSADLASFYVCWTATDGRSGSGAGRGVSGTGPGSDEAVGREVRGLRTLHVWRCTETVN